MPDISTPHRIIRLMLGSFTITVPFYGSITPELLIFHREAITGAFNDIPKEILEKKRVFDQPIETHTIVTNVRAGSIEYDVIYQTISKILWADFCQNASHYAELGLHYLMELGEIAAGLAAIHRSYNWVKKRIYKAPQHLRPEEGDISIVQTSSLEIRTDPIESAKSIHEIRESILPDERPRCVGTILNNPVIAGDVYHARYTENQIQENLGGETVIRDLNYYMNGLNSSEDLRPGDVFFFNNPAALGLKISSEPDSLYSSAQGKDPDVDLVGVTLRSHEVPDSSPQMRRGRPVDADDLEDA